MKIVLSTLLPWPHPSPSILHATTHQVAPLVTQEFVPLDQHLPTLSSPSSWQTLTVQFFAILVLTSRVHIYDHTEFIFLRLPFKPFRTTDVVANGNGSFSKAKQCSPGHIYHVIMLVDRQSIVVCWNIVNTTTMAWGRSSGRLRCRYLSLDYIPKSMMAASYYSALSCFVKKSPTVFHDSDINLFPTIDAWESPCFLACTCSHLSGVTRRVTELLLFLPFD